MHPKHAFGVVVRAVGLVVVLGAVLYLASGIILLFLPHYRPNVSPAWRYFLSGAIGLALGLYLLRGAPHVIRFSYRDEDSKNDGKHDA